MGLSEIYIDILNKWALSRQLQCSESARVEKKALNIHCGVIEAFYH
jgi:hypothetical protein